MCCAARLPACTPCYTFVIASQRAREPATAKSCKQTCLPSLLWLQCFSCCFLKFLFLPLILDLIIAVFVVVVGFIVVAVCSNWGLYRFKNKLHLGTVTYFHFKQFPLTASSTLRIGCTLHLQRSLLCAHIRTPTDGCVHFPWISFQLVQIFMHTTANSHCTAVGTP